MRSILSTHSDLWLLSSIEIVLSKESACWTLHHERSRHVQRRSDYCVSHVSGENLCDSVVAVEPQKLNAPGRWAVYAGHRLAKRCPTECSARYRGPLMGDDYLPKRLVG